MVLLRRGCKGLSEEEIAAIEAWEDYVDVRGRWAGRGVMRILTIYPDDPVGCERGQLWISVARSVIQCCWMVPFLVGTWTSDNNVVGFALSTGCGALE